MLWARPSVNVIGLDAPRVAGAANALLAEASAKVSLRVPPGMNARDAQRALIEHLRAVAPWNVRVDIEEVATGEPFEARGDGPAFRTMASAMAEAYGRETGTAGQGGSIPLCNVLQTAFPAAEIMLLGVEEPRCLIHAPNESVDPSEIERMALATALFLERYGTERT
jgi:acetylornithine deacetylase/succinyl-diaminopimelate desuccinylase-like protein